MPSPDFIVDRIVSLQTLKEEYLRWILNLANGNKAEAARLLQIDRSSLYRLLKAADVRHSRLDEPRAPRYAPGGASREDA